MGLANFWATCVAPEREREKQKTNAALGGFLRVRVEDEGKKACSVREAELTYLTCNITKTECPQTHISAKLGPCAFCFLFGYVLMIFRPSSSYPKHGQFGRHSRQPARARPPSFRNKKPRFALHPVLIFWLLL